MNNVMNNNMNDMNIINTNVINTTGGSLGDIGPWIQVPRQFQMTLHGRPINWAEAETLALTNGEMWNQIQVVLYNRPHTQTQEIHHPGGLTID